MSFISLYFIGRFVCCQSLIRRCSQTCGFLGLPWLALRLCWLSSCSIPAFSCLALGWIGPWLSRAPLWGWHRCAFRVRRSLSCLVPLIQGMITAGRRTFRVGSQGASRRSWRGYASDETCAWYFAGWMLADCSWRSWFAGRHDMMTRLTHWIWLSHELSSEVGSLTLTW